MAQDNSRIAFYIGEYDIFDNLSAFAIVWKGKLWPTLEHAYQAAKFEDESIITQIQNATSAHGSKEISHKFLKEGNGRKDWQDNKVAVMRELIRLKADQHPHVMEKLLETKGQALVEDAPTDSFWGRGPNHDGENWAGKLWMEYRDELLASR